MTIDKIDSSQLPQPPPPCLGPYPRNSAETAWNTPTIREALLSVMESRDIVNGMVLSKESFQGAVRELWRTIDLKKVEKTLENVFNAVSLALCRVKHMID